MKRVLFSTVLLGLAASVQAQDTYLNDRLTNTSGDVYGTSRFVGMAGAMGALGADISTMSWNPAGIGVMRKSDFAFTAGGAWGKNGISNEGKGTAILDQAGFVYVMHTDGSARLRNVNIGFNYQKKQNYMSDFYADHNNLLGRSQMNQLSDLVNMQYDTNFNLAGLAFQNDYFTKVDGTDASGKPTVQYINQFYSTLNRYTQHTRGSLQGFDFNVSGNVQDQVYWGLTFNFDHLRYKGWSDYYEESYKTTDPTKLGDYSLLNDYSIKGFGFGMKFGTILRPFAEKPFRVALVIETPTWYRMESSTLFGLVDQVDKVSTKQPESYLEYAIRTPWKVRLGIGSTVSNFLAWDVDYEYTNRSATKMGYPKDDVEDAGMTLFNNTWDEAMNLQTKDHLKGMHSVRAGVEVKPTSQLAFRIGYIYATSPYKDNPSFNQYDLNSYAMNYSTSTSFMTLSDINTLTLGVGYKWKRAYLDFAYKLKNQKADFYAFDTSEYAANERLEPVNVDLTRHQLTATLGVKF